MDSPKNQTNRKRRGSRQSKKKHRSQVAPQIIPGVRREIPTYDLASEEGLDIIEPLIPHIAELLAGPTSHDN